MNRGKRLTTMTIHSDEALRKAVEKVAKAEDRTMSQWLKRKIESDPMVQTVLQHMQQGGAAP